MKRLCFVSLLLFYISFLWGAEYQKSAIVYYGTDISWPMLGVHDYIILEPSHVDTYTHGFKLYRQRIYAYVSVGEVKKERPWYREMKKEWFTGQNSVWKGSTVDLGNSEYRRFLLDRVIDPLFTRGFKNLFLDTIDVCDRMKDEKSRQSCREGSAALVHEIKKRHPNAGLIVNRGFHIFDKIKNDLDAVLFESYYRGLKDKEYVEVSAKDRLWLDKMLAPIEKAGVPIIALDYLENPHGKEADRLVQRLKERGFIPYVSDRDLLRYGHSTLNTVKREILLIYDGTKYSAPYTTAHIITAMPLEYQGYIPILWDIRKGLPSGHLEDRFAGVVFEVDRTQSDGKKVVDWILKYAKRGLKSMLVGDVFPFGMSDDYFAPLGVEVKRNSCSPEDPKTLRVNRGFFFEMRVPLKDEDVSFALKKGMGEPLLAYENRCGKTNTLAAKTWWGGYVARDAWLIQYGNDVLWISNPFKIFHEVLGLPEIPVPDPTTENGRRILFSHIDGDGMINRAEWNGEFAGKVILDQILKKYPIPHSVSVVGGEILPNGLDPKDSPAVMKIARQMYALPNVEAASHTFSHPFKWGKIDKNGDLAPQYRLNIPGYRFNLDFELSGFVNLINRKLLPKGKPKARTIFWSGDCLPGDDVVAYVYRHNLLNINGGDTYITKDHPWLSYIAPFGIRHGHYWQIYSGEQNENVYTDHFTGLIWGYVKVIQTFQMTDSPRRFKPIDIYYHFYGGSKQASLNALKKVFNWAMKQSVIPLYTTEYIPKVMDFYAVSIARRGPDSWKAAGLDNVRTLRMAGNVKPGLLESQGCVGYEQERNVTYLHFDGSDHVELVLKERAPQWSLESSNGRIGNFDRHDRQWSFKLQAHVPLKAVFRIEPECSLKLDPKPDWRRRQADRLSIGYRRRKKVQVNVVCH